MFDLQTEVGLAVWVLNVVGLVTFVRSFNREGRR